MVFYQLLSVAGLKHQAIKLKELTEEFALATGSGGLTKTTAGKSVVSGMRTRAGKPRSPVSLQSKESNLEVECGFTLSQLTSRDTFSNKTEHLKLSQQCHPLGTSVRLSEHMGQHSPSNH